MHQELVVGERPGFGCLEKLINRFLRLNMVIEGELMARPLFAYRNFGCFFM